LAGGAAQEKCSERIRASGGIGVAAAREEQSPLRIANQFARFEGQLNGRHRSACVPILSRVRINE
jgi:hypothetical protein